MDGRDQGRDREQRDPQIEAAQPEERQEWE
jgi:hypothetical protein